MLKVAIPLPKVPVILLTAPAAPAILIYLNYDLKRYHLKVILGSRLPIII
jgi:hypothetical protein